MSTIKPPPLGCLQTSIPTLQLPCSHFAMVSLMACMVTFNNTSPTLLMKTMLSPKLGKYSKKVRLNMFVIFLAHQKNKPRALPPNTPCCACDNSCRLLFAAHGVDHIPQVCMSGGHNCTDERCTQCRLQRMKDAGMKRVNRAVSY